MVKEDISSVLSAAKKVDMTALLNGVTYEKDPSKQAVYLALYNYRLAERQKKTITKKEFIR